MSDVSHDLVLAPAGWGHVPGVVLAGDALTLLPDLPLLKQVNGSRQLVLAKAVTSVPGLLAIVRPSQLVKKYGVPQSTASESLRLARAHKNLEALRG